MSPGSYIQNGEWVIISAFSLKVKSKNNFLHSLRFRILLLTFITGIIPVLCVSEVYKFTSREDLIGARVSTIKSQAQIFATQLSTKSYSAGTMPESLDEGLMQLSNTLSGRIVLVDSGCKVLKDSYNLDEGKTIVSTEVVNCLRDTGSGLVQTEEGYISFSCPIYDASQTNVKGALVILGNTDAEMIRFEQLSGRILIIEMVCMLLIAALSILLSKQLVKPFGGISDNISKISDGYSGESLSLKGYTEIETLSDSMNTLIGKMETLDNSRQEFVSNVSHELRTPITSMKVLADSLLVQEDVPVEMYREFMVDITAEIDREDKIINDLLSLVKMDKSSPDLNIEPLVVNDVIELILKRLLPIAARNNVELVFESFRPVTAEADEVKLTLALSNLIENAIKYNVEGGWVHVSLNADHQYFYVKVADSGIGIPEDSLENIYERFYRVDKSHSREIGGTGLGLAIARSSVLKHRGSIQVQSKEGEGTTFTVRIPLTFVSQ